VTSPANGAKRPASSRAKVVLPLPLAPIKRHPLIGIEPQIEL
jgi:hypothetical protein